MKSFSNSPFHHESSIDFSVIKDNLKLILNKDNKFRIPVEELGTGIQQLFYILVKIFNYKPSIILLEEIELNLSPRLQTEFLRFIDKLIEKNELNQLFFTTHSALLCYRGQNSIFKTTVNNNGTTAIEKQSREDVERYYGARILTASENTS